MSHPFSRDPWLPSRQRGKVDRTAGPPARRKGNDRPTAAEGSGGDRPRPGLIKSCDLRPLKRLSLVAFEHIGTQEIRGMLILVCALTLALAIGCCVGGLMVRLKADKVAVVRRAAFLEQSDSHSGRCSRRRPHRPEPPAPHS